LQKPITEKEINLYPISVIGFCNYIGCSRNTLCDYGHKENFSDTVEAIKSVIEQFTAEQLFTNRNTAGIQFILKNCFKDNWIDKSIVESKNTNVNTTLDINFVDKED